MQCNNLGQTQQDLGKRKRQKLASEAGAIEVDLLIIVTSTILKAPTLAKSFASPPLAAIANDLGNDDRVRPIYMTTKMAKFQPD